HCELKEEEKTEKEFFQSLAWLAGLYKLDLPPEGNGIYPYNITLAYQHAAASLKKIRPELSLIVVQDERHTACLATTKVFDTSSALYYINVRPLHVLMKRKESKPTAALLLSVFAWLHQVVKVPYYADKRTYLFYCYRIINEWIKKKPGGVSVLRAGADIYKKIGLPHHLDMLARRVNEFTPVGSWERCLHAISRQALGLYTKYPDRSVFNMVKTNLLEPGKEKVCLEQYLSFFWDEKDRQYHSMIGYVNTGLEKMETIDGPMAIQLFDRPQEQEQHDLDFAERLFGLVEELAHLLNRFDNEEY
ncbi:MAG TPA: hypothetical protein VJ647_03280, partial [Chitinophagaceae bacterium]|nr:hypothetical protein [Chitinophagaceae bacterium]